MAASSNKEPTVRVHLLALALALPACSSGPAVPTMTLSADRLLVDTGDWEIAGGAETVECFYMEPVLDRDVAVTGGSGMQGEGGHHAILFYTTSPQAAGHHPCTEEEMASFNRLGGGIGEGGDDTYQNLPPGFATRVPAGAQIVAQIHYFNFEGGERTVRDQAWVDVVPLEDVETWVSGFVVYDGVFEVPARSPATHTTTCTVTRDVNILVQFGHMHDWGRSYLLEIAEPGSDVFTTMYEVPVWEETFQFHPPLTRFEPTAPLVIRAGSQLRQTCTWQNDRDTPLLFPTEMCVNFMLYYPDLGEGMIVCEE
jgi:hypothetical protein